MIEHEVGTYPDPGLGHSSTPSTLEVIDVAHLLVGFGTVGNTGCGQADSPARSG
jgi:hypothetical protein